MNILELPNARKRGLVVQELPNEVLVYDLERDEAHCLNETAAAVWRACDGKKSVPEIASAVRFSLGEHVSDDVIWLALDQLSEHRLLEEEISSSFSGQSRREVLKRIGVASMVALPIIASLAAPRSVLANVSCACAVQSDCQLQPNCPQIQCLAGICSN